MNGSASSRFDWRGWRADVAERLFSRSRIDGFAFDVELFLLAERLGIPIVEVPVRVANAASSSVQMGRDSRRMIEDLVRMRRWARDGSIRRD